MKGSLMIGGVLLAVAAAVAWLAQDGPSVSRGSGAEDASKPSAARSNALPRSIAASAPSPRAAPKKPKTVYDDLLASRQYRALYDRLNGTPEGQTPKGRLVMYEVLRECASVQGLSWPFAPFRQRVKRDDFVAALAPNDPRRERRIAAYDQYTADKCAGFGEVKLTKDELMQYLRDAAAGGEPAARAMVIEHDLWTARHAIGTFNASPDDAQVRALEEAAASRDPDAIRVAGRVLVNGWKDYAVRIGPDELPVESKPFVNAWLVLACEYGAPCGQDTPRMQHLCAMQGHCDAQSFPDYLAYYGSTPNEATLLMQYRALIRNAIETGDWSQIRVVRAPNNNERLTFIPGPR